MSKYRRDDKAFREQIAKLADAGLRLDRSIKTAREAMVEARGFNKAEYPANFNGVPAYVRTIEPLEIAPKGKLIAGAIAATIVLLLVAGAAYLGWRIL